MRKVGEILRNKREEKKLNFDQISSLTKISIKYLRGLEEGDFSVFPADVYAFGFLRKYSEFLGLNSDEMVDYIRKPVSVLNNDPIQPLQGIARIRFSKEFYFILGIILLLAVAFIADSVKENCYFAGAITKVQSMFKVKQMVHKVSEVAVVSEDMEVKVEEKIVTGLNLRIIAEKDSWLRVSIDGKNVYEGTLLAGTEKEWLAIEKIGLNIGYVPGISVFLNNEIIDIKKGAKQALNFLTLTKDGVLYE